MGQHCKHFEIWLNLLFFSMGIITELHQLEHKWFAYLMNCQTCSHRWGLNNAEIGKYSRINIFSTGKFHFLWDVRLTSLTYSKQNFLRKLFSFRRRRKFARVRETRKSMKNSSASKNIYYAIKRWAQFGLNVTFVTDRMIQRRWWIIPSSIINSLRVCSE